MRTLSGVSGASHPHLSHIFSVQSTQPAGSSNHPGIDEHFYNDITDAILTTFYKKTCCGNTLSTRDGKRALNLRCPTCHKQVSIFRDTPLAGFKLPRWMFGYIIHQMALKHPQVMTSTEISKRLNITYKSALLLKRRIQLFASEVLIPMQRLFYSDMKKRYKDFKFPSDRNKNLTAKIRNKPIPQTDTLVLFSCSERANKGRKRYKRKGQTSSIYLSERLGGHQIGTLVNTLGVKNGPVFFDSIGDQKASTLNPIIMKYIPTHAPLFSDMGYKGYPGMNHRMVNHSARSDDKRHRYAKNRWSKNGIHCNVAEGNQAKLKRAFAAYTWIRPKYSQLYLNEYAFFGNRRFFALSEILGVMHGEKAAQELHLDRNGVLRCLYSNLYSRGDLNPHGFLHTHLKRTCLPIPPPEHGLMRPESASGKSGKKDPASS